MTTPTPTANRRSEERRPVRIYGRVWFGREYGVWADCEVRDLSAKGARLELAVSYELPRRLIFVHQLAASPFQAILRWQRGAAAGLSIETSPAGTQEQPWLPRISEDWRNLLAALSPSR